MLFRFFFFLTSPLQSNQPPNPFLHYISPSIESIPKFHSLDANTNPPPRCRSGASTPHGGHGNGSSPRRRALPHSPERIPGQSVEQFSELDEIPKIEEVVEDIGDYVEQLFALIVSGIGDGGDGNGSRVGALVGEIRVLKEIVEIGDNVIREAIQPSRPGLTREGRK